MLEQFTAKEKQIFLVALLAGALLSFGANFVIGGKTKDNPAALDAFKSELKQGIVTICPKKCKLLASTAELRSTPTNLAENTLLSLTQGTEVEFIESVPSMENDTQKAAAAYDLQFSQLFHRTVYIPKGTPFTIVGETDSEYTCSFILNGKSYKKKFMRNLVLTAYTGTWNKVSYNKQIGYIPANQMTTPAY